MAAFSLADFRKEGEREQYFFRDPGLVQLTVTNMWAVRFACLHGPLERETEKRERKRERMTERKREPSPS